MKKLPTIRIKRGFLLEKHFKLPTKDIDPIVENYKKEWNKRQSFVFRKLYEITDLSFIQDYIDVYVVNPKTTGSISEPMIIGAGNPLEDFVCVLTHELLHRLTTDNNERIYWNDKIQKLYPEEKPTIANHVMVHAILEAIFNKQTIERDIKHCQKFTVYKKAWEIVKKDGYKNIIAQLK